MIAVQLLPVGVIAAEFDWSVPVLLYRETTCPTISVGYSLPSVPVAVGRQLDGWMQSVVF